MDKKLKILLDKVKESDPNLNTMDRNTRIRAGNYQFPFLVNKWIIYCLI